MKILYIYPQGVREYSSTLSLEDELKVNLVIIGSVAVSKTGMYTARRNSVNMPSAFVRRI